MLPLLGLAIAALFALFSHAYGTTASAGTTSGGLTAATADGLVRGAASGSMDCAKAGVPGRPGAWPRFGAGTLSLVPPRPQGETDYAAEHQCGFWAALESHAA